ncbi:hypothetical protein [Halorussus litoreus]|uniref:hypothetical protein n=1 Tax=Halorussus litoreus TaxID=1710536 RepID=UPI000E224399|nr:hypothetical protein [Halorussus litoreus]
MKRTLSTVVERVKRLWNSSAASGDEESADERDAGPDLYECAGCGAVFISKPDECSTCEDDDFTNVGSF